MSKFSHDVADDDAADDDAAAADARAMTTGDNHVTCVQLSKPDVATLSYRRSHY